LRQTTRFFLSRFIEGVGGLVYYTKISFDVFYIEYIRVSFGFT